MKAKSNNYRGKVDISVSQNFITSKNTIYKLIKKTNISKNDFVIEIGPGKGHITEALCEKSYWVTAIELDRSFHGWPEQYANVPGGYVVTDGSLQPGVDVAIIEAAQINEDGFIVPTTSVGISPTFVSQAKKVIVEVNVSQPLSLVGMHDIYARDHPRRTRRGRGAARGQEPV